MSGEIQPRSAPAPRPVTPVGIIAATLESCLERLAALGGADDALTAELRRAHELASGLDPYLSRCTTPESPALRRLAGRTQAEDWSRWAEHSAGTQVEQEMLSGHVEGQALKFLVHLTRARRVLELGMFTGYSALAMAEALPPDGELVACELDAHVAAYAQRWISESPSADKIAIRVAPAQVTLEELAAVGERFDVIFIDADKPGYLDYLQRVLDTGLLEPHGLICVDNTLMQGQPYTSGAPTVNGSAIAAFNQSVAEDPRVEQVLLPLRDGLTLIRRV